MNAQRLAAAGMAAALSSAVLSGCNGSSGLVPSSPAYGTLEAQRMTPQAHAMLVSAIQKKIKHVFVIFQENHSFDNYFGTYPGAENLGTALAKSHGYTQYDPIGKRNQSVFKITDPDILGPSNDRYVVEKKYDGGKMDKFIAAEEQADIGYGSKPTEARQYGIEVMSTFDCDTIPYLWMYAKNFTLLDHYFQVFTGPSAPSNVSLIAAQTGISEEHHFPALKENPKTEVGVPLSGDDDPFDGPYTSTSSTYQIPQSYATMPLLYGGADAAKSAMEKGKIPADFAAVEASNEAAIPWMWAQEGFVNGTGVVAKTGYVAHHNAPQYFDYLRKNNGYWSHDTTAQAALTAIKNGTLGDSGVVYVKGSKDNEFGWKPANKAASIQSGYLGDDDHPGSGNSDHQIAEAFVATFVNAVAHSKYWDDSAIIISWDDDGGFYDHVPPVNFEKCSDGYPCGDGSRLPFLIISPYVQNSTIIHDYSDTASISKFIENVFGIRALGSLPDEKSVEPYGPGDVNPDISDLVEAFDLEKLDGNIPPIPAEMAEVPDSQVGKFPPQMSCKTLGITPLAVPTQPPYFHPTSVKAIDAARIEAQRNQQD
jgi:phospholipase C